MIEVVNRQRKTKISCDYWRNFAVAVNGTIIETGNKSFTIAFVSDKKMRDLNKKFRGKNLTTDVLSFPFEDFDSMENSNGSDNDYLGDIVISVEQAARQADENDLDFDSEVKQLVLHGILHLCGFDHEADNGEMNEIELKYRRKLKINF